VFVFCYDKYSRYGVCEIATYKPLFVKFPVKVLALKALTVKLVTTMIILFNEPENYLCSVCKYIPKGNIVN